MDNKTFMPEYIPSAQECAFLYDIYRQPGFAVLQRIFQSQVDMFAKTAMNLPLDATDATVAAHHRQAKAAVQFYAGVTDQINIALNTHKFATVEPMLPSEAKDSTEDVLDIDDVSGMLRDLPILL